MKGVRKIQVSVSQFQQFRHKSSSSAFTNRESTFIVSCKKTTGTGGRVVIMRMYTMSCISWFDTVLSWSFDLLFQSSGITSHASLDGSAIRSDLDAITVSVWLRTSDRLNQGTPLSYATDQQDNELAITDCNGFVVYVAGEGEVTDVSVADGTWHHVAVTWRSRDGVWNIYKDGQRQDGGRGLASGRSLKGYLFIHFVCMKLCICMQICCVNCQFYLLVLVVTTFVFIFPFLMAAVRAVSLVRPGPLFFLFAVLCGLLWNK